ncbi:hypothetical protein ACX80T_14100 [Arthrobacter sp. Sr33]
MSESKLSEPDAFDLDWRRLYRGLESQLEIILLSVADKMEELERSGSLVQAVRIVELQTVMAEGVITATCVASAANPEFAFFVYGPGNLKVVNEYGRSNSLKYVPTSSGSFRVWAYVRNMHDSGSVALMKSESIEVQL